MHDHSTPNWSFVHCKYSDSILGLRITAKQLRNNLAQPLILRILVILAMPVLLEIGAAGITIRLDAKIERTEATESEVHGIWDRGDHLAADLILVGIGAVPNDALARDAGLACDNGIIVDSYMRTEDPSIFAIGDCTSFPSASLGRRIRLESVQNANDQARCAARTISGHLEAYTALPWFWSDQGTTKIQIAGLWEPQHTRIVRGDPGQDKFSVLHFEGDLLTSVESVNSPADHIAARKLIANGVRIPPEKASDPSIPLKLFE